MHRGPVPDTHANGCDFAFLDPDPGQNRPTCRPKFKLGQKFDQQVFNPSEIFVQILTATGQIDDGITDELTRPVIRRLTAAIGLKKRVRKMRRAPQASMIGRATNCVNGVVFEEKDRVGYAGILAFLSDYLVLQSERICVIKAT